MLLFGVSTAMVFALIQMADSSQVCRSQEMSERLLTRTTRDSLASELNPLVIFRRKPSKACNSAEDIGPLSISAHA
jgi:hypothetical protein